MNLLRTALSLFLIIFEAQSLKILGIFPYQGKSHFYQFRVYLQELAHRGHNVTVISYFPSKSHIQNYHDIALVNDQPLDYEVDIDNSYLTILLSGVLLAQFGMDNCKTLVRNEKVRDLVIQKAKFDVVVVEQFNSDCALGIAYKLGAPVVGITSHILMPHHYKRLGIPDHPAYVPFHFLGGGSKPNLFQRVERTVFDFYFKTLYKYEQWVDRNTLSEQFGDIPPLEELAREIKFLLVYHSLMLTGSRLYPSNVIEIGGYHVPKAKPLTGELKKFVDGSEQGVIYLNFGSLIKLSALNEIKLQTIVNITKEFPQRFIMRFDKETINIDKNKIFTATWLPQIDILAHPKTLAFISHGGMGSTTEAVYYGVPIVVIPHFGDQPSNAAAIEESGLGVQFDSLENIESLRAALKKVLDPKFRARAAGVSRVWHDRPMSPMDTAVYWTEFAARNANFTFRTPAADVPLYQHLYLDIAAVLGTILFVLIYVIKTAVSCICFRSNRSMSKNKAETQRSKGKKKSKRE